MRPYANAFLFPIAPVEHIFTDLVSWRRTNRSLAVMPGNFIGDKGLGAPDRSQDFV